MDGIKTALSSLIRKENGSTGLDWLRQFISVCDRLHIRPLIVEYSDLRRASLSSFQRIHGVALAQAREFLIATYYLAEVLGSFRVSEPVSTALLHTKTLRGSKLAGVQVLPRLLPEGGFSSTSFPKESAPLWLFQRMSYSSQASM